MTLEEVIASFAADLDPQHDLVVEVPLPSVGSSNSYLDLVEDFADASLICERLGACAREREMNWGRSGHMHVIRLTMRGYDSRAMAQELARMAILLDYPNCQDESLEYEYHEVLGMCAAHIEQLHSARLLFPQVADHYLGNLVMGAYYEWEDTDFLQEQLQRHPERRYGFFISRSVGADGEPVLSSDGQLIVPSLTSLAKVLEDFGFVGDRLLPARLVMTEHQASFVADHAIVGVRAEDVINAIACGDDFVRRTETHPDARDLLTFQGRLVGNASKPSVWVAELSGIAAIDCVGFTVLFLDATPVAGLERVSQAAQLQALGVSLHDGGSPSRLVDLRWEALNDELFEQLCYDYLYAFPLFDKHRLEKIGKSRSRDGGRDIVAWTSPAAPIIHAPVKYIFQCKHIRPDSSLTAKHLQAVSDVIEQYGAGGYGVMCSGYIDATLHDKIDAIAARRAVEVRKVDRFQLERFLSNRPNLVEKYFGCGSDRRR